ncbi:hypothetical protein EMIHUDRAFT_447024 [Emiliania huxleyi CCMP1516]|uniref:Uncharacterized protein n=2 Tax=Emiliania huxleyi TaxID=2903 RepID=A0A0D3KKP8_EMIH1|nr:hypothetical protein EMIHUDRAFT_447024 [Emiliania huxleyi CCMP1516]EOD36333.1 hypothetical protein EMIHUDRAFT_447024 [Emiliania huxleyi CCMP1516]|eukprot:XP_005788762.1 hypothetical protein EMIHUDRAFT_447024 [Emiliania huxleyi CCMP1516]
MSTRHNTVFPRCCRWARRSGVLGKSTMLAQQLSQRGGARFPEIPRDSTLFPEIPRDFLRFYLIPRDSPRFPEIPRDSPRGGGRASGGFGP